MAPKDLNRFLALKGDMDAGLNSHALVLSEEGRRKLKTELPASAHWKRTDAMLTTIILQAQTEDFGIPAPEYLETMSQKVVVGEIKELANQTAQATGQTHQRIERVQNNATGSVSSAMDRFAQVFHQVGSIVASIAAVIEEQAAAMGEMAGNIAKTSTGLQESRDIAGRNATVAGTIVQEIVGVNEATAQLAAASRETLENARQLAALATNLQGLVGRFQLGEAR